MDEYHNKLKDIMHNITYKVEWKKLKVDEESLKLLNEASGDVLAEIAYKNRIPFAQFIQNADELIDNFNEHKFQLYISDIKDLKNSLEAPIQNKPKESIEIEPITIDPDKREREIMEAAINEVFEGKCDDEDEDEELINVDDFLARQQVGMCNDVVCAPESQQISSLVPHLASHSTTNDSTEVSVQRNASNFAPQITLPDNIMRGDPIFSLNEIVTDFPEQGLDDLANLGLFDGQNQVGKKIFDNLYDKEKQPEIRRTDEELLPPPLLNDQSIRMTTFNKDASEIPDLPPLEQDITPQTPQAYHQIPIDIPPQQQENGSFPHQSMVNSSSVYNERLANIANVENEADTSQAGAAAPQAAKKKAKRKIVRKRLDVLLNAGSVTKFNKPVVVKLTKKSLKKRKRANIVKVKIRNEDLDIFGTLNDFVEYELPYVAEIEEEFDDDEEMLLQQQQQQQHQQLIPTAEELTNVNITAEDVSTRKRRISLPQPDEMIEDSAKRVKVVDVENISIPTFNEISIPLPPPIINENEQFILPDNELSGPVQTSVDRFVLDVPPSPMLPPIPSIEASKEQASKNINETSIARPMLQSAITAAYSLFRRKTPIQPEKQTMQITAKDCEYSRVLKISKQVELETPSIPMPPPNEEASDVEAAINNQPAVVPEGYREYRKNGTDHVEFLSNNGTVVKNEEYNLENFAIYLQVRKYMKRKKSWKVKVQDLVNDGAIKLLYSAGNDKVIENRLWLLCEEQLLAGIWSDNDLNLLEIEIPIIGNDDKENVP